MEFKQPVRTLGAFGLTAAAGLIGSLAFTSPAQAEVVSIPINDGNVPTLAADWEQSCDQVPDDIASTEDGWVFVLPASAGVEDNFIAVYATFEDEQGNVFHYSTEDAGGVVAGQGDNKAYIVTPAGLTLVDAEADVNDPDEGAFFNLTHTCAGEPGPGEEETTPVDESPSEGEESSAPGESTPVCVEETGTPGASEPTPGTSESPCEEATEGAGQLPTTGTPLTIAIVSAAALAAGGAALFLVLRRRRAAQDW